MKLWVIDNGGAYSNHVVYFVVVEDLDDELLRQLLSLFSYAGRAKLLGKADAEFWEGEVKHWYDLLADHFCDLAWAANDIMDETWQSLSLEALDKLLPLLHGRPKYLKQMVDQVAAGIELRRPKTLEFNSLCPSCGSDPDVDCICKGAG